VEVKREVGNRRCLRIGICITLIVGGGGGGKSLKLNFKQNKKKKKAFRISLERIQVKQCMPNSLNP
jgi:hypothetical protein